MVLENMASFHATGYHFLQNYKNGVIGFSNDHPDFFDISGWIAPTNLPEIRALMDKVQASMCRKTIGLLKTYGGDEDLIEKMQKFMCKQSQVMTDSNLVKDHYKFQTIIHNDLHMSNVMFK